jgi:hypothetical protein
MVMAGEERDLSFLATLRGGSGSSSRIVRSLAEFALNVGGSLLAIR